MKNNQTQFKQTEVGLIPEDWEIIISGLKDQKEKDSIKNLFKNANTNGVRGKSIGGQEIIQFIIRHFDITDFAIAYSLGKVLDKVLRWFINNKKHGLIWVIFSIKQGKKSASFNLRCSDKNIDKITKFLDDSVIKRIFEESKNKAIIEVFEDKNTGKIKTMKL